MNSTARSSRLLGIAYLIQLIISLSAMVTGILLKQQYIVPDNIGESLIRIGNHDWLLKANALGELLTSIALIFLASMLYVTLKRQNKKIALVALGFYALSATILAVSRFSNFDLLRLSHEYITTGRAGYIETMATLALASMEQGIILMQVPICLGAALFYFLFYKSRIIPRFISLYGLVVMAVLAIASAFALFGNEIPVFLLLLYAPVEPAVTAWLLIKGVKENN